MGRLSLARWSALISECRSEIGFEERRVCSASRLSWELSAVTLKGGLWMEWSSSTTLMPRSLYVLNQLLHEVVLQNTLYTTLRLTVDNGMSVLSFHYNSQLFYSTLVKPFTTRYSFISFVLRNVSLGFKAISVQRVCPRFFL